MDMVFARHGTVLVISEVVLLHMVQDVIEAGALQGDKMEKMTVTGNELPGNSSDFRLNLNANSVLVSLAQFQQVLVDHPLLLLVTCVFAT